MLKVETNGKGIMLAKKIWIASICGLLFASVSCAAPALAQGTCGPPSPPSHAAGCLPKVMSYYTNQAIYSGNCRASTLHKGVETVVAQTTAYPFSSNLWDSGWTGEMVLKNPSKKTATTFKLTEYIGGFQGTGSTQPLKILPGDTIVVPFSRAAITLPSSDSETLEVTITPAKSLTCQKVSYYTWEHD